MSEILKENRTLRNAPNWIYRLRFKIWLLEITINRLQQRVRATYKCLLSLKRCAFKTTTVSNSRPLVSNVVPITLP